jgi:hypothetical protein
LGAVQESTELSKLSDALSADTVSGLTVAVSGLSEAEGLSVSGLAVADIESNVPVVVSSNGELVSVSVADKRVLKETPGKLVSVVTCVISVRSFKSIGFGSFDPFPGSAKAKPLTPIAEAAVTAATTFQFFLTWFLSCTSSPLGVGLCHQCRSRV